MFNVPVLIILCELGPIIIAALVLQLMRKVYACINSQTNSPNAASFSRAEMTVMHCSLIFALVLLYTAPMLLWIRIEMSGSEPPIPPVGTTSRRNPELHAKSWPQTGSNMVTTPMAGSSL